LVELVTRFRKEQAPKPLYMMIGERSDRHRLDRDFLAALSLSNANLLELHGNRLAICHRFHCHALSATTSWNRMLLAALTCCIPLMTSLT
jgi:hypothetical protein